MKIIAETPNDRVLVSLKISELANIIGEFSQYDVKREFIDSAIKHDTEIEVSDIYAKHSLIHEMQKEEVILEARHKLTKLLKALTPIESKVSVLAGLTKKS